MYHDVRVLECVSVPPSSQSVTIMCTQQCTHRDNFLQLHICTCRCMWTASTVRNGAIEYTIVGECICVQYNDECAIILYCVIVQ